jgi:hypothetical protein
MYKRYFRCLKAVFGLSLAHQVKETGNEKKNPETLRLVLGLIDSTAGMAVYDVEERLADLFPFYPYGFTDCFYS